MAVPKIREPQLAFANFKLIYNPQYLIIIYGRGSLETRKHYRIAKCTTSQILIK